MSTQKNPCEENTREENSPRLSDNFDRDIEARLAMIRAVGVQRPDLLITGDRLTRAAVRMFGASVSLVAFVDQEAQRFKSLAARDPHWESVRETPLSHSYCKYVVASDAPLIVEDSTQHPVLSTNLATTELGVRSYAGFPIRVEGVTIGAFCVLDEVPREWTEDQLATMSDFSKAIAQEVELRWKLTQQGSEESPQS